MTTQYKRYNKNRRPMATRGRNHSLDILVLLGTVAIVLVTTGAIAILMGY